MSRERIWLKVVLTARPWKIGVLMNVAKFLGVKVNYYCGGGATDA